MEPPTFSPYNLSSLIRLPATKRSKFKQNDDDTEITDCEVLGRDENLELNSKITRNNEREKRFIELTSESTIHKTFNDPVPPEIHKGYKKLVACYKNGLERMQVIYKQDVIKSEPRSVREDVL